MTNQHQYETKTLKTLMKEAPNRKSLELAIHQAPYEDATLGANIPSITVKALLDYYYQGINPGSFLQAVLENKLKEAFQRSGPENRRALHALLIVIDTHIPSFVAYNTTRWMRLHWEATPRLP